MRKGVGSGSNGTTLQMYTTNVYTVCVALYIQAIVVEE